MPYVSKKRINNSLFAPVYVFALENTEKPACGFAQSQIYICGSALCVCVSPGASAKFTRHASGGFSFWQMASNEVPAVLLDSVHRAPPLCVRLLASPRARCRMPLSSHPTAPTPLNYSTRSFNFAADSKAKKLTAVTAAELSVGWKARLVVCVTCWLDILWFRRQIHQPKGCKHKQTKIIQLTIYVNYRINFSC